VKAGCWNWMMLDIAKTIRRGIICTLRIPPGVIELTIDDAINSHAFVHFSKILLQNLKPPQ
ncbi:hypothetical protein Tco_1295639, partial [Tanacetum coccineum]